MARKKAEQIALQLREPADEHDLRFGD